MAKHKTDDEVKLNQLQRINIAKELYIKGTTHPKICQIVGCGTETLRTWIDANKWDTLRTYQLTSPNEVRQKTLHRLSMLLDKSIEEDESDAKEMDQLNKLLASLPEEKLQQSAMLVFMAFYDHLLAEAKYNPKITDDFLHLLDNQQDNFLVRYS